MKPIREYHYNGILRITKVLRMGIVTIPATLSALSQHYANTFRN